MIGLKIKYLRENLGLTQVDLADRIGASQQQVHRWENSKVTPSADTIAKISEVFGVSADYLLDTEQNRQSLETLSPMEKKLILALRNGSLQEALKSFLSISQNPDESDIAGSE